MSAMEHAVMDPPGTVGTRSGERVGESAARWRERALRAEALVLGMEATRADALRHASAEALRLRERLERLQSTTPGCLVSLRPDGTVDEVNPATEALLGRPGAEILGSNASELFVAGEALDLAAVAECSRGGGVYRNERNLVTRDGSSVPTLVSASAVFDDDGLDGYVAVMLDLRDQKALEAGLRHAQKLEAVGQLAAGIAHEINTPSQYVGDSVWFVQKAMADLGSLLETYRAVARASADADTLRVLDQAETDAGLAYLQREVPDALTSALGGIRRIDEVVSAMQAFAKPNQRTKTLADLNKSIRTALTIARHSYKYVAEVDTDLAPLPDVRCHIGDIHQVLATLILWAARAVEHSVVGNGSLGKISLRSYFDESTAEVVIEVSHTGGELPEAVAARVFDTIETPCNPLPEGTHGMFVARMIVVDGHGGSLTLRAAPGRGSIVTLRLPRDGGGRTDEVNS